MSFFSASSNSSKPSSSTGTDLHISPAATSAPTQIPVPKNKQLHSPTSPSFFSSAFGSFFGKNSPDSKSSLNQSQEHVRASRSLSLSGTSPITPDQAMNLSRAGAGLEGNKLTRVPSVDPESVGPTDLRSPDMSSSLPSKNGSSSSPFGKLNPQSPASNPSEHGQRRGSDSFFRCSAPSPPSPSSSARRSSVSAAVTAHRLRRNSGAKYQGIGLVAAYDQGGIL